MASGFSSIVPGGPPPLSDLRIVLLGRAGAETNKIARVILGDQTLHEESKECVLYEGEQAGRRICIVDTPGWISTERCTQKIKNEIARSVTLCAPGPHVLVLVLPVFCKPGAGSILNELELAIQHIELLSERVWKYTLVLFLGDEVVDESTIQQHIRKAKTLLERCGDRNYVMFLSKSETQLHGLLEKINMMVKENLDDFFLPPVYYEEFQRKIQDLKKHYEDKLKKMEQEDFRKQTDEPLLEQRRGSSAIIRPNLNEDKNQAVDIVPMKSKDPDDLLKIVKYYFKPISLLVLAVIGALIGSVVGSEYGVVGSGMGIVIGSIVTIPVSLCLIKATSMVPQSSPVLEKKND